MINAYNMYSWGGFSDRVVHCRLIHAHVSCCFQAPGLARWHYQAAILLPSLAGLSGAREGALNYYFSELLFFSISLQKKSQLIIFNSESCSSWQHVWELIVADLTCCPS